MFGYKTIRETEYNALKTELKGYYGQTETINEYLRIIGPQLRGLDMGKIAGFSREDIKNAYETMAPVMGVVNYIADSVGEVARFLELRDVKRNEYLEKHWILDLLAEPNDRFTRRKFFTAWAVNKLLFGDAFVYAPIEPGKDRTVREMYVLPGQRIALNRDGELKPLKGVRISGGVSGEIDVEGKVFESFDYNLDDTSFFGTSKVAAAAVYLTVMDRAMNRQATSLKNGGPANIVTPAAGGANSLGVLPSALDDMEQKMNATKNSNRNIAMKTAIEVHQLGDKPADLSILTSHEAAVEVLCFVFKVPFDIFKGQAKYENAKEAKKTIYEQIAIPMVNEFAEDFLHYLRLAGEYELTVNTDEIEILRNSRADVLVCLEKMHASLNELREANGYEPIDEPYAYEPILPVNAMFGNEGGAMEINEP